MLGREYEYLYNSIERILHRIHSLSSIFHFIADGLVTSKLKPNVIIYNRVPKCGSSTTKKILSTLCSMNDASYTSVFNNRTRRLDTDAEKVRIS